ncbi:MAG: hypothetical protein HOV81_02885 [Kofleriaceae bacterium]|nr:hypothetical protein [Kofleriaceae bacterium]
MQGRMLIALALASTLVDMSRIADACTIGPTPEFAVDAAYSDDMTPPPTPTVTAEVYRGDLTKEHGCSETRSSCGDKYAGIELRITSLDDRAPFDKLGYHVRYVSGDSPSKLKIVDGPVLGFGGSVKLPFDPDDESDFAVTLEVSVVDLNGNYSEPTIVTVSEDHLMSCSASQVDSRMFVWLAVGFVLWPRRRLRRTHRVRT